MVGFARVGLKQAIDKFEDRLAFRHRKFDLHLEPSPNGGIEQIWMIGSSEQKSGGRPVVDLLQQHSDEPLQFTDLVAMDALAPSALRHLIGIYQHERDWNKAIEHARRLEQASGESQVNNALQTR